MTDIQIKFWQNYETQRANRAAEYEKYRSASAQEQQKRNELVELQRHNVVQEDISRLQAQISSVHAAAAQRQAAVSERLAQLNAMRYELEKTLNNAQVAKIEAEQAKVASETTLNRSKQFLVEQQTYESAARTLGQNISNETAQGKQAGEIMGAYTKPISDIFGDITKVAGLFMKGA